MHCFEESRELDCSAAEMYAIVLDIEAYPQFLPWVADARILSRNEDELSAELVADFSGMQQTFRTIDRFIANRMIEIRLLDGPFHFLESLWTFEAISDTRCRVHFSIEFEFSNRMLSLVATPLFQAACKSMVRAFEERAANLRSLGS